MSTKNRILIAVLLVVVIAVAALVAVPRYTASRRASQTRLDVDISALVKDGYTDELVVLPASDDWAVLRATNMDRVEEADPGRIYALNLKTGKLSEKYIPAGRFLSLGSTAHTDGTVSVCELANGKRSIVFVDPRTLAVTRQDFPDALDIWCLSVSPDKTKVAYTVFDGTYVANLDFSGARQIMARNSGNPDNDQDDELEKVMEWTTDGSRVVYVRVGYEWAVGVGAYDVNTNANCFFRLGDKTGRLTTDNRFLAWDVVGYDDADAGFGCVDLSNGATAEYREIVKWGSVLDAAEATRDGKYIITYSSVAQPQLDARTTTDGAIVASLSLGDGTTATSLTTNPSGDTAILTLMSADYQPSVVLWRFVSQLSHKD